MTPTFTEKAREIVQTLEGRISGDEFVHRFTWLEFQARIASALEQADKEGYERGIAESAAACRDLQSKMSSLVLRLGGQGIGQVYGTANCSFCKQLTNDYYFIGPNARLCPLCWESGGGLVD